MKRMIQMIGGLGALALLSGCGTGTQAGAVKASHPWRAIVIDNAGVSIQAKVPPSWPLHFVVTGAGDGIEVGTTTQMLEVVHGNPYHWHPNQSVTTAVYGHKFDMNKELPGLPAYDFVAVSVPNTAANRVIARKIIASVKKKF